MQARGRATGGLGSVTLFIRSLILTGTRDRIGNADVHKTTESDVMSGTQEKWTGKGEKGK